MTASVEALQPYVRPETARIRPLAAWRAFRKLVRDKEDTTQVFEVMRALSGRSLSRGYERLLRDPEGGRQAFLAAELVDRLGDEEWLQQFEPGTVGAAYRVFMQAHGFSADGLMAVDGSAGVMPIEHPRAWYGRRLRDLHDTWHVLAGYDTDALGEACVVAFSYAQTGQLGFAAIALGAALEIQKEDDSVPALRAVHEAWRNGRKARWLPAEDYARLFSEPMDSARKRLNLKSPSIYIGVPQEVRCSLRLRAAAS